MRCPQRRGRALRSVHEFLPEFPSGILRFHSPGAPCNFGPAPVPVNADQNGKDNKAERNQKEGMAQTAEIAEMTGWREGTVRSRLTRARAKLGALLKGDEP